VPEYSARRQNEAVRLGVEAALVDGALVPGDVEVAGDAVARLWLTAPGGRGVAVPGFVDLQVNGIAGVDLLDTDQTGYHLVGEALLAGGVTAYLPTFVTSPEERLVRALRSLPVDEDGARILGAHLEGPFISELRLGMHSAADRRDPDLALLERLLDAGPVSLVTLAPELPGGIDLVRALCARGIAVSLGHTDAAAEEADVAFDQGARSVTHVFNAMRPLRHRDPGVVGAALARDDVVVQMILDDVHLSRETARIVWRSAGGRVALVSDSTPFPDGRTPEGVLAGSTQPLIAAVRRLVELGATLEEAVGAVTEVPARLLARADVGRLAPGARADVVVLGAGLEVERVLVGGVDRLG
jgi:N-acetylglucosamine-6-phosphate deacetylase